MLDTNATAVALSSAMKCAQIEYPHVLAVTINVLVDCEGASLCTERLVRALVQEVSICDHEPEVVYSGEKRLTRKYLRYENLRPHHSLADQETSSVKGYFR